MEVIVDDDEDDMVTASERIVAWLRGPRSAEYHRVRALVAKVTGVADAELPVIPLRLTVDDERCTELPRQLQRVCEILAAQPDESAAVRLTHFTIGTEEVTLENGDLAALAALRATGVQVTDLPITCKGPDDNELIRTQCLEYIGEMAHATPSVPLALEGTSSSTRPGQPLAGVETISLSSSLHEHLVPSVLSVIQASASIRTLLFEFDEESPDRSSVLQWLAFAITRRREPLAQVLVSNISQLQMADIEIMRQVVTAPNPLTVLYPEQVFPNERCVAVTSSVFLSHPKDTNKSTQWAPQSPVSLEVIGKSHEGFVPVLLPGWGKAWVKEDTVSKKLAQDEYLDVCAFHSPTQLVVKGGEDVPTLLAFIRLVGGNLKQLKISEVGEDHDTPLDEFSRQVLMACPHLEELMLYDLPFDSLEFIVNAFEANQCPTLTSLKLFSVSLVSTRGINAMMHALSDPTHAMAKQLKKLVLVVEYVESIEPATPERTREMLQRNSTLRDFELTFVADMYPEECQVAFDVFNQTELLHDAMPLPSRSACAFLSAVSRSSNAMQQLDSGVVRHILGFASSRRVRTVRVSFG